MLYEVITLHAALIEIRDANPTYRDEDADNMAKAIDPYVHGAFNLFNHRTNVDVQNRLVCFDTKEAGSQLKTLAMHVIQDHVWGRVSANRAQKRATRYYIDEFHLLLKDEITAAYSAEIWKRFRVITSYSIHYTKLYDVVAVAFEQVDRAPYGKACADGGDEGLQYVDCAVEEFHFVDLLLLFV